MSKFKFALAAGVTAALFANIAVADVIVDSAGVGFVGKGDVQSTFGWNNHDLQANAGKVLSRYATTSETRWTCSAEPGRSPIVVTVPRKITQSLGANIAFDAGRNREGQVTGFNLNGFDGSPATGGTDGPALYSCPPSNGQFTYDNNATTTITDEALEVSIDGTTWLNLPITQ